MSGYASGWHSHLALLIALLEGAPRPAFWAPHLKLREHYGKVPADIARKQA